jgi:hypothetical protein
MKTLMEAITAVVKGDLKALTAVRESSHAELLKAAEDLPRLVVSRNALANVLEGWRGGLYAADDVQRWASFVRRGYVSAGPHGALRPIEIEYDSRYEALIAEIIGRFDEIGDLVDGCIDASEQEEMLQSLRS